MPSEFPTQYKQYSYEHSGVDSPVDVALYFK